MSDITISVIQPPSTTINVGVDETTLIQAGIGLPPHSVTHISGGSDEINHNLLAGLQGGSGGQYYHLSSGQYFNLVTGIGSFYPNNNPSGFITGVDLSPYATITYVTGISGQLQAQITVLSNQTGQFYLNSNPSGFITGVDLSPYTTVNYVTGISGELQTQITNLNNSTGFYVLDSETGQFYPNNNPSGYITGIDLSNYTTTNYVTGVSGSLQNQIINLNNQTGSYVFKTETGNFILSSQTGQFYSSSNPSGYTVTGYVTGVSGNLQSQITNLNNQTGLFYPRTNPSGYITGINNLVFTTGNQTISGIKTFSNNLNISGILSVNDSYFDGSVWQANAYNGYVGIADVSGINNIVVADYGIELEASTRSFTLNAPTRIYYPLTGTTGIFLNSLTAPNLVYNTGAQTIGGAKTFSNDLTVNGGDLFVDTSNNRVGINTTSPTATLDVNGSGIFRSGLFVNNITARSSDLNIRGFDTSASSFGGGVIARGGTGLNIGGPITLEGGSGVSAGGQINIIGGRTGTTPNGVINVQSPTINFNQSNLYSSNVVFYKTGLSAVADNVRISQNSISINNNLLITGNRPTVNSTGILLSGEATTQAYVTGISGGLQTQITTLNNATGSYVLNSQTGVFYPRTNPSGYITGVDLSFSGNYYTKTESESRYVNTTGAETILGNKTFHDNVYINNLYVTGLETIVNTTNTNVASNYITLNLTGGAVDGGIFFITGSGLTGINDSGAIIGFDHSDKFKFGISTRASDLSTLNTIASVEQMTGISGGLQTQISTLNNQTGSYVLKIESGQFYPNSNPSGFITNNNLLPYATQSYVTGISGDIQTQITALNSQTGTYALKAETGNFITNNQTGQFYADSNPSGFITGVDLSSYATQIYVTGISGDLQTQITDLNNSTGQFYLNSNPSGYITGVDLSTYATIDYVTGISGDLQAQITDLSNATGSYVLNSQTGDFYANSNPSGFITGINDLVYTTGDQSISGNINISGNLTISGVYNIYQQIENAKILSIAYAIAL